MIEFIANWWLEFLLGAIGAGLGALCRHYYKLYKADKQIAGEKFAAELKKEIFDVMKEHEQELVEEDNILEKKVDGITDSLDILKQAMLSFHAEKFKKWCDRLLDPNHVITLEDFELISHEHTIYNSLGGNHDGDTKFELVELKAKKDLVQ